MKQPVEKKKEFSSAEDFPRFTENGFTLLKCPEETWNLIKESYELLKDKKKQKSLQVKKSLL